VSVSPLAAAVDAFHAQARVATYTSLATVSSFVYSVGVRFAAVTLDTGQVFPYVQHTRSSEGYFAVRIRLLQRSVHVVRGYLGPSSMTTPVSAFVNAHYDDGFLLGMMALNRG
jgi:hypothetical protein